MILLITLIIVSLLCVWGIIHGIYRQDNDALCVSLIFAVLVGIFGWAALGNALPINTIISNVTVEVVQSHGNTLFLKDGVVVLNSNDYIIYNKCKDKKEAILQKETDLNMYGSALPNPTYKLIE